MTKNPIRKLDERAAELARVYAEKVAKLDALKAGLPSGTSTRSAIASHLTGGPVPNLMMIAGAEVIRRDAVDAIEAERKALNEGLGRERATLDRQRKDAQQAIAFQRTHLGKCRERIRGRQTARFAVDDYLKAAAEIGEAELQDAVRWVQKNGVGHYADEWLGQRDAA